VTYGSAWTDLYFGGASCVSMEIKKFQKAEAKNRASIEF